MTTNEAICKVLKNLRHKSGKTMRQIAMETHTSNCWIWRRESSVDCIRVTDLLEMLDYYNVSIDEFIEMVRKEMDKND